MTVYKGINGFAVQSLATDPTFNEGQVWYNNASYAFKVASLSTTGSWATSGNMNQARGAMGSSGTATAGLAFGTYYPYANNVEKYDGSVWTTSTVYPLSIAHIAGCGTQTATLTGGGSTYTTTANEFNGTSWTATTAVPYGAEAANLFGIQTSAIFFGGGLSPGPSYPAQAVFYNGSTWAASPSLNNSNRYGSIATGTSTAGLAAGGGYPFTSNTEKFNGTSWTASGAIPFTTYNVSGSGVGTQTAAMLWFGSPANTTTQYFNGTSWSNQSASLTYAVTSKAASAGTQSSCFSGSGDASKSNATTNNWTGAGSPLIQTITTS